MNNEAQLDHHLPTMAEFCLNVPLYQPLQFNSSNKSEYLNIYGGNGNLDYYCIECKQPSVFCTGIIRTPSASSISSMSFGGGTEPTPFLDIKNHHFSHIFKCARDANHELYFHFRVHNNTITKIGQYPSIADISAIELQKYRKVLGKTLYPEFSRAVGLSSHGIGIGAFVYLRRIFENLIEQAHQTQIDTPGWDEDSYQKSHIDEKIALLANSLPQYLVQHKTLYSILSKGIHELTEDECLEAFPITKLGIELILDEQLEKLSREEKIKQSTKDIGKLNQKLKERDT